MATTMPRRAAAMLLVLGCMLLGQVLIAATPARGAVTGGCKGSVDFSADDVGEYTPDNDTRDNPIVIPKDDGNVAAWKGSVPGANTNFGGNVEIRLGPVWLEVADWGSPNYDGSNVNDERSDSGNYDMDQVWDVVPKSIAQGIYEARAKHNADGVDCKAMFFVKFEGNALSSPIVIAAIILLIIALYLLILSGRRRDAMGLFAGRPVLAVIAALLLGLTLALVLQQFSIWPLDNLTVVIIPIVLLVIGLLIAKFAPFGGRR